MRSIRSVKDSLVEVEVVGRDVEVGGAEVVEMGREVQVEGCDVEVEGGAEVRGWGVRWKWRGVSTQTCS